MGVLPLQFNDGESRQTLGLTGRETYDIVGLTGLRPGHIVQVVARDETGAEKAFEAVARIDSDLEYHQYRHGGILPYIFRRMMVES
jgi:aconitate hydratase